MAQLILKNAKFGLSRNEKIRIAFIFAAIAIVTVLAFSAEFVIGRITAVRAGLGIVAYTSLDCATE